MGQCPWELYSGPRFVLSRRYCPFNLFYKQFSVEHFIRLRQNYKCDMIVFTGYWLYEGCSEFCLRGFFTAAQSHVISCVTQVDLLGKFNINYIT